MWPLDRFTSNLKYLYWNNCKYAIDWCLWNGFYLIKWRFFLCWVCRIDVSKSCRITLHTFIYLWFIWQGNQSFALHIEIYEERIMNWEVCRRRRSWCNLKSYQGVCLEELRETLKISVKIFSLHTSVYATRIITLFRYSFRYGRTIIRRAYQLYLFHSCYILLFKYTV